MDIRRRTIWCCWLQGSWSEGSASNAEFEPALTQVTAGEGRLRVEQLRNKGAVSKAQAVTVAKVTAHSSLILAA